MTKHWPLDPTTLENKLIIFLPFILGCFLAVLLMSRQLSSRSTRRDRRAQHRSAVAAVTEAFGDLQVPSASNSVASSTQPSLRAVVSATDGAPSLRVEDPVGVTAGGQEPSSALSSLRAGSFGGALDGVPTTSKLATNKLHVVYDLDTVCLGVMSSWGVCLKAKGKNDKVGVGCKSTHRNKVKIDVGGEVSLNDGLYVVPAKSRNGPETGVKDLYFRVNKFSLEAQRQFHVMELTPEGWVNELCDPINFATPTMVKKESTSSHSLSDDDESIDLAHTSDELVGRPISKHEIHLGVTDVDTLLNTDEEVPLDKLREIVMSMSVHSSEVASILVRFQDALLNHGAIISANVDVTKKVLTSLLERMSLVETGLGDLDELPFDCDSVIAAIASLEDKVSDLRDDCEGEMNDFMQDYVSDFKTLSSSLSDKLSKIPPSVPTVPPPSVPTVPSVDTSSSAAFDENTTFLIDGKRFSVADTVRKVSSLTHQLDSNGGFGDATFKDQSFADEKAALQFLIEQGNAQGAGLAGFVTALNMFVHRSGAETKKSDATATSIALSKDPFNFEDIEVRVCLGNKNTRGMVCYYSSESDVPKEGTPVPALKKYTTWFGTDGCGGTAADIKATVTDCQGLHETYVNNHFPEDATQLRKLAMETMTASVNFHTKFHDALRSTFDSLSQLGLQKDKIMQLFSDWLHIMNKKMYNIQKQAYSGAENVSNVQRLARQILVTWKVLAYQEEILSDDFMKHPSLSNAYVRTLTVHLGQLKPTDEKLKELVVAEIRRVISSLESQVSALKVLVTGLSSTVQALDARVKRLEDKIISIEKYHPEVFKKK